MRAQQQARYNALNITPSDDNFTSVFRPAPDAAEPEPASAEKGDRWSITYDDICAAALPNAIASDKATAARPPAESTDIHCDSTSDLAQQRHQRPACSPHAHGSQYGDRSLGACEQVPAHGGRHRRNASRDEGGFEKVLGRMSLPGTPAGRRGAASFDNASDMLTDRQLCCSEISTDEVSDDGSTSLEDMSDTEILTSSPPLALPRPAPKPTGDPRLSLRLYKLVSRSVHHQTPKFHNGTSETCSRPFAGYFASGPVPHNAAHGCQSLADDDVSNRMAFVMLHRPTC